MCVCVCMCVCACVCVCVYGDKVWLDSKHTPIDIPYKLTARWFGPFEVLSSDGAAVTLDLPETFFKSILKSTFEDLNFMKRGIRVLDLRIRAQNP